MYEDDAALVAKVRSGSRDAFGTLVVFQCSVAE